MALLAAVVGVVPALAAPPVGDMTYGPWSVLGGTGAYTGLRGRGTVTGTFTPGGVIDLYEGWLQLR